MLSFIYNDFHNEKAEDKIAGSIICEVLLLAHRVFVCNVVKIEVGSCPIDRDVHQSDYSGIG